LPDVSVAAEDALAVFHPRIAEWFRERVGEPTGTQARAWPEIAAGRHVLVTAPTGSGKTLTAFLWALHQLLTGAWPEGRTRVLYVSPLRALNNDIRRNLLLPLAELEERFAAAGEPAPGIRVQTRSGDTPPNERQRMVRTPPEILITTPESLNILLTSKGGRSLLDGLRTVILDEIHAVAGSKRGTHLITAVDRLVPLAGDFQRVALSATIRPLERIARFVGGYRVEAVGEEIRYRPRPVEIVRSEEGKRYDLEVVFPEGAESLFGEGGDDPLAYDRAPESYWDHLARDFRRRIRANRSTLLFANSRRKTELVTRLLNADEAAELAYSHHGSLSREIRAVVEKRLKEGRLAAIVSTNSLELGIDIGALDEVLLIQTPPTIAGAVQRIGRAGHRVGEVSRGRLYPLFGRDFVDAAVVAEGVLTGAIEAVRPVVAPLDVLAQVILSMVATESRDVDELYGALRASDPYHELSRRQFDLVLEMLAGRYADSRIRELEPQLTVDRAENRVRGRRGAARRVFLSGGTIPDRGYFTLRTADSLAKLGELDEEFVWERSVGDTFTLGAQNWRVVKVTHNDVLVSPARRASAMAPFWRAEARNRGYHLSERIGRFLEVAQETLAAAGGGATLARRLGERHAMAPPAAAKLVELLERQRAATGGTLPHRRHLLVERFDDTSRESGHEQVVLHTFWGGRVNRPLAIALAAAWEERYGGPLQIDSDNDCLILALPRGTETERVLELVRADNVRELLRRRLERTGFFGARFRENAGRALLLPRSDFRRRVPLWLNRERAKKLLDRVARYEDFPVLVETWRDCLQDAFELEPLERLLEELARGEIGIGEARTATPSPFAAGMIWQQTNRLMYEDDTPEGRGASGLSRGLMQELVFSSRLRPRLPAPLLDRFQRKLHRTFAGYAPRDADELVEWVRERVAMPLAEWRELLAACERDGEWDGPIEPRVARRVVRLALPRRGGAVGSVAAVCAVDAAPRLLRALDLRPEEVAVAALAADGGDPDAEAIAAVRAALARGVAEPAGDLEPLAALVAEWARAYGPFRGELLTETFGLSEEELPELLEALTASEAVVVDHFREVEPPAAEVEPEICDAENLERLLRILRAESRPSLAALPLDDLPLFLAAVQGLAAPGDGIEGLQRALERLLGYPAPAAQWETDLLPARLEPYYPAWLDSLMQESELLWVGCGEERTTFAFPDDLSLLREGPAGAEAAPDPDSLFPDPRARYPLDELARRTGRDTRELSRELWRRAWRGEVSNTTYLALRRGLLNRFEPSDPTEAAPTGRRRRPGRRRFERWQASRPFSGDWYALGGGGEPAELDALDREELARERVRLLLQRYGILFRELTARELPELAWGRLFRSLRLMELSGEIVSGHFFEGIHGLQFVSAEGLRWLRDGLPRDAIFWMSAVDPAAPSGLGLEGLRGAVPSRLPSSHLVFHGARRVVTSRRNAGELQIEVAPEHPHLEDYLAFLKVLLTRQFAPLKAIDVETINGDPAGRSPYAARLAGPFSATRERAGLRLRRRY